MNGNGQVGQCVDFVDDKGVQKQGYKIIEVLQHALKMGDTRYKVKSNFGNGNEEDIIFPDFVTRIYNCDADNNVEMKGGRKSRKSNRKSRKSNRKGHRKSRKSNRKGHRKSRKGSRRN